MVTLGFLAFALQGALQCLVKRCFGFWIGERFMAAVACSVREYPIEEPQLERAIVAQAVIASISHSVNRDHCTNEWRIRERESVLRTAWI